MNIATVYVLRLSHATLHDAEFAPTTPLSFEMIDFCLVSPLDSLTNLVSESSNDQGHSQRVECDVTTNDVNTNDVKTRGTHEMGTNCSTNAVNRGINTENEYLIDRQ